VSESEARDRGAVMIRSATTSRADDRERVGLIVTRSHAPGYGDIWTSRLFYLVSYSVSELLPEILCCIAREYSKQNCLFRKITSDVFRLQETNFKMLSTTWGTSCT